MPRHTLLSQIFAKLRTSDAAQVCRDKINGRTYGGQLVQVRVCVVCVCDSFSCGHAEQSCSAPLSHPTHTATSPPAL